MELQQFVTAVITQLVNGMNEAHEAVSKTGAIVNPANVEPMIGDFGALYGHIADFKLSRAVHKIDFDVAVTASEEKETKGGIGIAIASIGLGTSGKSDTGQSTTSRIRFAVPIAYPEKSCP